MILLVALGCSRERQHDAAGDAGFVAAVEAVQVAAVDRELAKIHDKVATDAVAQYEIAKRQGDRIQTCVSAGLVSAAFLQAKNEPKFTEWKATEKADCAAAGLSDVP